MPQKKFISQLLGCVLVVCVQTPCVCVCVCVCVCTITPQDFMCVCVCVCVHNNTSGLQTPFPGTFPEVAGAAPGTGPGALRGAEGTHVSQRQLRVGWLSL